MNQITGVLLFLIGVISTDRTLHRNAKYHNECIKKMGECEGQKGFFFFMFHRRQRMKSPQPEKQ